MKKILTVLQTMSVTGFFTTVCLIVLDCCKTSTEVNQLSFLFIGFMVSAILITVAKHNLKLGILAVSIFGMILGTSPVQASADMNVLKPALTDYFTMLQNTGNIPVAHTFAPKGWFRKDWDQTNTFMRPVPENLFFWSNGQEVRVRVPTLDPPVMLMGYRAYNTADQGGPGYMNTDKSIPKWDKIYVAHYRSWSTRNCLDLGDMVLTNELYERLLASVLRKHGIIDANGNPKSKYKHQIEALGVGFMFPVSSTELPESVIKEFPVVEDDNINPSWLDSLHMEVGQHLEWEPVWNTNLHADSEIEMFQNPTANTIDWFIGNLQWLGLFALISVCVIIFVTKRQRVMA